jgi:single-strand DNA-binding protein
LAHALVGCGRGPVSPGCLDKACASVGLDVDEIGPSLRFATANVRRMTRSGGNGHAPEMQIPTDDPWSTATPPNQRAAA